MKRNFLVVGGIVAILVGLLWIAQGTGLLPYPVSSIMVGRANWSYFGAALAASGVLALVMAQRG